jgi:FkbM family methyltransferase
LSTSLERVRRAARRLLDGGGLGQPKTPTAPPGQDTPDPWSRDFSTLATEEDILYCFRLLLGRWPQEKEWPGHSSYVGDELSGVVASYLNSMEFANRDLLAKPDSGVELCTINDVFLYTAVDDMNIGKVIRCGSYEEDVTTVFRRFLSPGMGVVDVGANVGYFTMLAASLVGADGYVLAVEPNPENMKLLEASRRANGFEQVETALTAAGRSTSLVVLNTSYSNGTTTALPDSAERAIGANVVPCFRVDDIVPADRQIDLMKVDAEGAEYNVLLGSTETIARCRPVIISEFSPEMMLGVSGVDGRAFLQAILDLGYLISIIESDGSLTSYATEIEKVLEACDQNWREHVDIVAEPIG